MNEIKFDCPRCGQPLTVPSSGANMTVACPHCGQAIVVPPLAHSAAPEAPKKAPWLWIAAAIIVFALLAAGILVWQLHPSASRPTLEKLSEKQFRFTSGTANRSWYEGFLKFQSDGKLSGSGVHNPNQTSWTIDEQGHLVFKHQDGRVSTIFVNADCPDGRWRFSGPFQFTQGITNFLKEVSPETVANEKWIDPLSAAVYELQNRHDADTANFVSGILDSLEKPGGATPDALAADADSINKEVRTLVQQGALENAAILQDALYDVIYAGPSTPSGPVSPPNPNPKTGGKPGPGGLVLYLPFDKPAEADGTVHDESGAGNDGKVYGAQWVPDDKFGGAYQFHITNLTDRIVIPNSDTLNPDTVTVSAWVKTSGNDGFWSRILDKDYRSAYCLDLGGDWRGIARRTKPGNPGFETGRGAARADRPVGDNRWHHIAASYDGTTVRVYLDGVERKNGQVRRPGPLRKNDWDVCIGNSMVDYGTSEFLGYDGLIDEVRIYNRALSPDEIGALARTTQSGVDVISPEAQAKARHVSVLNGVLPALSGHDPVSAALVTNILISFDQPAGLTSTALAADLQQMKNQVRKLVRAGDWESAGILNSALANAFWPDSPQEPQQPNHKTGGTPGPGGLVLYYSFDKPDDNGIIHDESGAGNDGQVIGARWVDEGKFGGAYHFALTNFDDRIVVPNSDSLNPQYLTITAWINSSSTSGFWRRIIDKDCISGYCFSLAGNRRFRERPWFEGQVGTGSTRALDDNQWHHVAATYDGQTARCYLDGVEIGSRRVKNPGPLKPDDWDLCIGNSVPDYTGELTAFDGLIDEVRIYNRALSADEIMSLATATHAGADVLPAPAQTGANAGTADRLKQVKDLYDQGLITKDQYDQKVKEIMGSM